MQPVQIKFKWPIGIYGPHRFEAFTYYKCLKSAFGVFIRTKFENPNITDAKISFTKE